MPGTLVAIMTTTDIARRQRRLNALPVPVVGPWYRRTVASPVFWLAVVLVPASVYFLFAQYWMLHPPQTFPDGTQTLGITNEAFRKAAFWAMWTAMAYSALFIWLDRFRASQPVVWLLCFLWGAAGSTWISLHVNSWAAEMMATTDANSDTGSRAAVFSAPFIEELSKATILVLLILLMRGRIVSRLSMVALAGLSAIGFAFTENIIYFSRVWMQATHDISIADPEATLHELVLLRGVYTSFGHPLFTIMTASGLVIGLGARSRIVRVLAPLTGFMVAAAGHMLFNGLASTNPISQLRGAWFLALGVVFVLIVSLVVSVVGNAQVIRARLGDYVQAGWLTADDIDVFGRPLRRVKLLWFAMFRGPWMWWRTATLVRRVTELAYLRDAMARGTVDSAGDGRALELIADIHRRWPHALTSTAGERLIQRRRRHTRTPLPDADDRGPLTSSYPPPQAPGPAGVGGNWPR